MTLAFAPFSLSGIAIISLAILCYQAASFNFRQALVTGFCFGLGYFGSGVSWVIVSIHDYGHLNYFLSALLTLLLIAYLAIYPALACSICSKLIEKINPWVLPLVFASSWVLTEFLRANLLSGFPWLSIAYSQLDNPLQYYIPIVGFYGLSFIIALCAGLLAISQLITNASRYIAIGLIIGIFLIGDNININWTQIENKPIKAGIIQANLAMHDKWDNLLFWQLVDYYQEQTKVLIDNDIIVWPESAIPMPMSQLKSMLEPLIALAHKHHTTLLLGAPKKIEKQPQAYTNSLTALGSGKGTYDKRHLVPFGEYLPGSWLNRLFNQLNIPLPDMLAGNTNQTLITINDYQAASLICYEVAFPYLLKNQLPEARFIVTLNDDGWFGHSLAMAQHVEMARFNSLLTGRYQLVANNNGLSAIIDAKGKIIKQLKPFTQENLTGIFFPATGATPWVRYGDKLFIIISLLSLVIITPISWANKNQAVK